MTQTAKPALQMLLCGHTADVTDVISGLIIPKLTATHRRCGYESVISGPRIPIELQTPGRMMVVFISGKSDDEWETLTAANRAYEKTPFGVVVLADARATWQRLSTYQNLRFLIDASKAPSFAHEQLFPRLQDIARVKRIESDPNGDQRVRGAEIAQYLDEIAQREYVTKDPRVALAEEPERRLPY